MDFPKSKVDKFPLKLRPKREVARKILTFPMAFLERILENGAGTPKQSEARSRVVHLCESLQAVLPDLR